MGKRSSTEAERFEEYIAKLGAAVGHADRLAPLRGYLTGLMLPGERKSVEPMAARVDPMHVSARHQSLHHFVSRAPWDEREVLRVAVDWVLAQLERHGSVAAWVVDDTGMPKKGRFSVGVSRQYCGPLGKQDNCQVAVSVSICNALVSVPCAYRLYLPEEWCSDVARRTEAGVPDPVAFRTKWELSLDQIDQLVEDQLPAAPIVADAGYGAITEWREGLTRRGLAYMAGVSGQTTVWPPGQEPLPPTQKPRGRPAKLLRRGPANKPVSVRTLAHDLPASAWRSVTWREGTRGRMASRFARLRVRPAHRDELRTEPRPVEWLLVEWPRGQPEPAHYWLSTIGDHVELEEMVRLAMVRWRIERDYQELKDELGLDHYEGRNWRGFHHHGTLCIAAYAFLAAERARLSPPAPLAFLRAPALPEGFQPRGAANPP